ncbi:MAG: nucleotidyltransferase domain-containing protein [Sulfurovum sp.]|nr:nucleotidyltransferase domain-containing protein [Sulfurovum sp.]
MKTITRVCSFLAMYLQDEDKQHIVNALKEEIPEVQAIYLFGSQGDGSATSKSDVDIAYLSTVTLTNVKRWEVSQRLASLLSIDVDLIDLSSTNTIFRYQILSTAKRLYGHGYEVESFETLAYSFYLRFTQERQPIVDAIMENKSVFGKTYA